MEHSALPRARRKEAASLSRSGPEIKETGGRTEWKAEAESPPRGNSQAGCSCSQLLSVFLHEEKRDWWQNLGKLCPPWEVLKARGEGGQRFPE